MCQLVVLGGEGGGHPHTTQALLLPTNNNVEDVGRFHWGDEGEEGEGRTWEKLGEGGTGAKRGRPCSKPPTKEVVRKRRKVGTQYDGGAPKMALSYPRGVT